MDAGTIRAEELVEDLARVTCAGKDKRLPGDFFEGDFGAAGQRVFGADHKAHAVFVNVMNFEVWRFKWHGDYADVHGAIFDALQDFVTEIAVDADVDLRVLTLKFGEDVGEEIEAGGFVGAENHRALNDVAAIGDDLDRFIAEAKETFGIVKENFASRGQLNGFCGTIEKFSAIGLFELANLGTDGGLRAENFLPRAGEAFQLSYVNEG